MSDAFDISGILHPDYVLRLEAEFKAALEREEEVLQERRQQEDTAREARFRKERETVLEERRKEDEERRQMQSQRSMTWIAEFAQQKLMEISTNGLAHNSQHQPFAASTSKAVVGDGISQTLHGRNSRSAAWRSALESTLASASETMDSYHHNSPWSVDHQTASEETDSSLSPTLPSPDSSPYLDKNAVVKNSTALRFEGPRQVRSCRIQDLVADDFVICGAQSVLPSKEGYYRFRCPVPGCKFWPSEKASRTGSPEMSYLVHLQKGHRAHNISNTPNLDEQATRLLKIPANDRKHCKITHALDLFGTVIEDADHRWFTAWKAKAVLKAGSIRRPGKHSQENPINTTVLEKKRHLPRTAKTFFGENGQGEDSEGTQESMTQPRADSVSPEI
ncbi:hypothetical protein BP6252_00721 [Coleophoma cylindrospora]|uniref:Uncharacterized protein n=1 Tax=Coleophoma cylindrospora TaxID=1849047 RepID=A0A3D8SQV8_9HELO|nr:hypothetical protein BP6252_00721 [Coleophoma cylindrospora]